MRGVHLPPVPTAAQPHPTRCAGITQTTLLASGMDALLLNTPQAPSLLRQQLHLPGTCSPSALQRSGCSLWPPAGAADAGHDIHSTPSCDARSSQPVQVVAGWCMAGNGLERAVPCGSSWGRCTFLTTSPVCSTTSRCRPPTGAAAAAQHSTVTRGRTHTHNSGQCNRGHPRHSGSKQCPAGTEHCGQ
jgi:hypothetical protein